MTRGSEIRVSLECETPVPFIQRWGPSSSFKLFSAFEPKFFPLESLRFLLDFLQVLLHFSMAPKKVVASCGRGGVSARGRGRGGAAGGSQSGVLAPVIPGEPCFA